MGYQNVRDYARVDRLPIAVGTQGTGNNDSSLIYVAAADTNVISGTPTEWIYRGPFRHMRARMYISSVGAAGTGRLQVMSLFPGQSGASDNMFSIDQDTGVQNAVGTYAVQLDGPIAAVFKLRLIVAGNAITAGVSLEMGG